MTTNDVVNLLLLLDLGYEVELALNRNVTIIEIDIIMKGSDFALLIIDSYGNTSYKLDTDNKTMKLLRMILNIWKLRRKSYV